MEVSISQSFKLPRIAMRILFIKEHKYLSFLVVPIFFFIQHSFIMAMEQQLPQEHPAEVSAVQAQQQPQAQPSAPAVHDQQHPEAQEQPAAVRHPSRNLIILNSYVVSQSRVIDSDSQTLLQALVCHVCPIIVRKSLLTNVMRNLASLANNSDTSMQRLNRISEILTNWHAFKTGKEDYCLLVPADENSNAAAVTARARELGLLVYEHLYRDKLSTYIAGVELFNNSFCTAKDVAETFMDPSGDYQWNIYLAGHGNSSYIAGFDIREFRDLLFFLNSRRINALIYETCNGAGRHLTEPYTEENVGQPIRLNYAIACASARFDISVIDQNLNFVQLFHELSNRDAYNSWDECFQAALRDNEQNQESCWCIQYVHTAPTYLNFPWIRNPGDENFHLLSLPLHNALPYTAANDQQQERPVVLNHRANTLLVESPCVNRPVTSDVHPLVMSVAANPSHYFRSLTISTMTLEQIAMRSFGYPFIENEMPSLNLIEECRCQKNGAQHRYTNVRFKNCPLGFWPRFMHFTRYGGNAPAPRLSKVITAECEDGKVIQTTLNQQIPYRLNFNRILGSSLLSLIFLSVARVYNFFAKNVKNSRYHALFKLGELVCYGYMAGSPIMFWRLSSHVNLSSAQLRWPTTYSWKTLSARSAQNYRNEFQRQRDELIAVAQRAQTGNQPQPAHV